MEIGLNEGESAEMEFRKAFYKHKFDRAWLNEIQKIENEHYTVMGAIIEFTRANTTDSLKVNPLTMINAYTDYKYELDLPFLRDTSEELMLLLC
jgi:hypothetical protein